MFDEATLNKLEFGRIGELLAEHCACGLGKAMARKVRPAANASLVRHWLGQVRQMAEAADVIGQPPLGGVRDIADLVRKSEQPAGLDAEELCTVAETLRATGTLQRWFEQLKGQNEPRNSFRGPMRDPEPNLPESNRDEGAVPPPGPSGLLMTLGERIGNFSAVADEIGLCIDDRARVVDDASPKLKAVRATIEHTRGQVQITFERILRQSRVLRLLQYPNATFHDDRCVLPLKSEHRGRVPGIVHRSSDSGATLFVEPAEAVELNNALVHLHDDERKEVNLILSRLSRLVFLNEEAILRSLEALAVLDLICAKVRYAQKWNCFCPDIRDDFALHIHEARHPLLLDLFAARPEQNGHPEVVPIDVRLGDDFDLLVITGPNTGGKTVALKTIGLLAAMVQAGIPVPVGRGSSFPVYRKIFIDIGDEQSLQQSLSTFSSHLSNMLAILHRAGEGSLVLLDELGAGTDPDEGAAIGRAVIDELLRLHCKAVVSTHLSALKAVAFTAQRVDNASVDFDVETLRPTYHLRIGEPGNSNAIIIAERLGMPRRLVDHARRHLDRRHRDLHKAIAGTLESRRQAERARSDASAARLEAEEAKRQSDDEQRRLSQQQSEYEAWVRWVNELRPGDAVFVRPFDKQGHVVRVQLHKQSALIATGYVEMEVRLSDLTPPQRDEKR